MHIVIAPTEGRERLLATTRTTQRVAPRLSAVAGAASPMAMRDAKHCRAHQPLLARVATRDAEEMGGWREPREFIGARPIRAVIEDTQGAVADSVIPKTKDAGVQEASLADAKVVLVKEYSAKRLGHSELSQPRVAEPHDVLHPRLQHQRERATATNTISRYSPEEDLIPALKPLGSEREFIPLARPRAKVKQL